jgi:Mor family transcriptional regulator
MKRKTARNKKMYNEWKEKKLSFSELGGKHKMRRQTAHAIIKRIIAAGVDNLAK